MYEALLPLLSTFVGAGITYWVNVRSRRRRYVEDLFNQAIAAVAAAEPSQNYIGGVAPWKGATTEEHEQFLGQLGREASLNHVRKAAEARESIARVVPYRPDLDGFYKEDPHAVYKRAPEIISLLRQGPTA